MPSSTKSARPRGTPQPNAPNSGGGLIDLNAKLTADIRRADRALITLTIFSILFSVAVALASGK